jgi:hypothetical protein
MERRIAEVQSHKVAVDITDKKSLLDLISSLRHGGSRRESGLYFVEGARMVRS